MQYDVVEVCEHFDISTRSAENNVLTILCPFHEDHTPSGKIDLKTGRYDCWACNKHTMLLSFLSKKLNKPINEIYYEVAKLDGTPSRYKAEDPANVEEWHVKLCLQTELLAELYKRCITDELIRQYRLGAFVPGEGSPAIRIPIRDKRGNVIAFKDYRPGSSTNKFSWPNCGVNRANKSEDRPHLLFPAEQLAYSSIVIVGGEIKAIAAAAVLNSYDIGAISGTGSETTPFTPNQLNVFKDKEVYVCYDIDEIGQSYAEKLCRSLRSIASNIYYVKLPLDIKEYPHGDVNDYLAIGGDLVELLKATPKWEYVPPTFTGLEDEEAISVSLSTAVSAKMAKKKVSLSTVITSMDTSPYTIPQDVTLKCDRKHKYCSVCRVYEEFTTEVADLRISQEAIEIMEMVGQKKTEQQRVLKDAFGIPQRCTAVTFEPKTFYHVEDVRISQHLDIRSRTNERAMQVAYCVGKEKLDLELNETYTMIGRMYPHPATQQATLLITEIEAAQDALSTYVPENLDRLHCFQPEIWTLEGLEVKLQSLYDDLTYNVIHIYGRNDLLFLYDLAYHSVLLLPNNLKGWAEVLVVGDSAQGKSIAAERMMNHYGLGERVVCKGATVPGLLGGVQQHGKRWFATWGKIPTHDRRLVILDEVKGTSPLVIAGLTDMRSSGIAELTKIEKRRTNARTRLIWISNPRSERVVREFNNGVDVVKEVIGAPEDIRRFDVIMIVAQKEVPEELIHAKERPNIPHVHTAELCRELVLWGWTVPHVEFENIFHIGEVSVELTSMFVENVPIVDSGTIREKLMRLATALAVRTFSYKDKETVYVRDCHIDYIVKFIKRIYSSSAFGYLEYSRKRQAAEKVIREDEVKARLIHKTPFPVELIEALLTAEEIDISLFQDVLGFAMDDARQLLAFLNRHNGLKRVGRAYQRTVGFTKLLKELEEDAKRVSRPAHIPEEF